MFSYRKHIEILKINKHLRLNIIVYTDKSYKDELAISGTSIINCVAMALAPYSEG